MLTARTEKSMAFKIQRYYNADTTRLIIRVHITGDIIDLEESVGVVDDLVVVDGIGGVRGDEGGHVRPEGLALLHREGYDGVTDGPGGTERGGVVIHLQNVDDESRWNRNMVMREAGNMDITPLGQNP